MTDKKELEPPDFQYYLNLCNDLSPVINTECLHAEIKDLVKESEEYIKFLKKENIKLNKKYYKEGFNNATKIMEKCLKELKPMKLVMVNLKGD